MKKIKIIAEILFYISLAGMVFISAGQLIVSGNPIFILGIVGAISMGIAREILRTIYN